ncbi:MAG: zf-TFIIB domain-containing protein [Thermoanaerobaculales bacterium]|jgi:Zn-finger nucleic acid-binding protein|nr:zf-TFIIB domain-containing protein [Thermoanaerobaculales bacterium]
MSEEAHGGVRLDLCPACSGAWFDGGELEALQAGGASGHLQGVPPATRRFEHTGESAHVRCPRCESDILRNGRIGRYRVMRCTSCRGLFLRLPDPRPPGSGHRSLVEAAVGAFESLVAALF